MKIHLQFDFEYDLVDEWIKGHFEIVEWAVNRHDFDLNLEYALRYAKKHWDHEIVEYLKRLIASQATFHSLI